MNDASGATYVTPKVRELIGVKGEVVTAPEPVERGAIRRFVQAIMDDDALYWDNDFASRSRFGGIVAPPLFPLHVLRQPPGSHDPLSASFTDPDYDGVSADADRTGLPPRDVGLSRVLNGGSEIEIYDLARPGDVIAAQGEIVDIYEKHGRSGPMVFIVVDTVFKAVNRGSVLLKERYTEIRR